MTLGLRGRMTVTAVAATATALVVVLALEGPDLHRRAVEQVRATLFAEARLMARVVAQPLAEGRPSGEIDALVDEAAREVGARVTIIAPDGTVIADSALSGEALRAVENHRNRPEVQGALVSGAGSSVRHSTTVGDDLLYAAVAIRSQERLVGVSRVALSLAGVEGQIDDLQRAVTVALAVAFALIALLSAAFSSSLAGPLAEVMDAARRFATGDLAARSPVRRSDEIGELARILNRSADQLQQRITEIARDRARIDAMLSAMEDGVIAVDHRGAVLLANQALRASLGLHEPVGRHYLEVVRQREVGELIEEVLRAGARRVDEVEMLRGGRTYAVIGVPFPGPEGQPPGAVLTFHDVTERHRVERVRRDFVANASHELRTPLTSIRGFVEALEDGAMEEPATGRRFLEKIRLHADRMAGLVSDLLELSRLESGERAPSWEPVAPAEVAEDVAASLAGAAERKRERRRPPAADPGEPRGERGEVHAGRRPDRDHDQARGRWRGGGGRGGRRARHPSRASPPHLRALLPRRQGPPPRAGGHGPRALHRQAPGRRHGRDGERRKPAGPRHALHGDGAAGARGPDGVNGVQDEGGWGLGTKR